jgi:hypothetical protein
MPVLLDCILSAFTPSHASLPVMFLDFILFAFNPSRASLPVMFLDFILSAFTQAPKAEVFAIGNRKVCLFASRNVFRKQKHVRYTRSSKEHSRKQEKSPLAAAAAASPPTSPSSPHGRSIPSINPRDERFGEPGD